MAEHDDLSIGPRERHLAVPTEHAPDPDQRRFVVAVLGAFVVLLGCVLALNVVVDPFAIAGTGIVPSAVENDRAVKLTLIEALKQSPEILILGSSRSRQAEPSTLQKLTGHSGFNAGVTGGTAADAYVFARSVDSHFPHQKRRDVWFVDVGIATNGINPQLESDPRASRFLHGHGGGFGLGDVKTYLSTQATRTSLRVLRKCVFSSCRAKLQYNADGSIPHGLLRYLPEQQGSLRAAVAKLVASVHRRPPRERTLNPKKFVWFEKTLAFMNAHGSRPVIVLNPIYPDVLAAFRRYGFPQLRAAMDYFAKAQRKYDFVVVNGEDIRSWGGTAKDWSNPTHVNWKNMRRLLKYVVANSDGALR